MVCRPDRSRAGHLAHHRFLDLYKDSCVSRRTAVSKHLRTSRRVDSRIRSLGAAMRASVYDGATSRRRAAARYIYTMLVTSCPDKGSMLIDRRSERLGADAATASRNTHDHCEESSGGSHRSPAPRPKTVSTDTRRRGPAADRQKVSTPGQAPSGRFGQRH